MKNKLLVLCAILLLSGCANKAPQPCEPIIQVEYVEVKVPVMYKLSRPARPTLNDQPVPVYLKELTIYTEQLEGIIDGTQTSKRKKTK